MIEIFAATTQIVLDATVVSATGFFGYCLATDVWKHAKNSQALRPSKSASKPLDGASLSSKPPLKSSPASPRVATATVAIAEPPHLSSPIQTHRAAEPTVSPAATTPSVVISPPVPAFLPPQPSMPELEPTRRAASTALIPYQPHTLRVNNHPGATARALVVSPPKSLVTFDPKTHALQTAIAPHTQIAQITPTTPQRTNFAGFWCLLALQERLGMAGFLEAHPHLKAIGFSQQLLWALGERLGIAKDDPVRELLTPPKAPEDTAPYPFIAPTSWQQGIYRQGTWSVHRWAKQPGIRVLFDASGRLAVALWYDSHRDLQAIREAIGGREIDRGATLQSPLDLTFLLRMWTIAMGRWCRRFARLGLRDLVTQPGWVYLTPTQIVVELESDALDRRIRQAGLNLDVKALPGWERDLIFD